MPLVPMVVEQSPRGERSFDIYSREYGLIDRVISPHELTRVPTGFAGRVER